MADFYEIDFLPVHTKKSGDAIAIRYQLGQQRSVHIVDGGYASTAPDLATHIQKYYGGTNFIDNVVVTHPDQDHAEGLAPILEHFQIGRLWMLRPWIYADELVPHFARYTSAQSLRDRLRSDYPYIQELERIALRRSIPILEPFQGAQIGPFTVLAPSHARYGQLILSSERTPQVASATTGLLDALLGKGAPETRYTKSGWGNERFSTNETSFENEMSVIQYAVLNGHRIVLTGDAGPGALSEAAEYARHAGLQLAVHRFQVPHHGGRRNVTTALLDEWLGPRMQQPLPEGQWRFVAMISSAKEDTDHPRKAVLRAMHHRGGFICTTENGAFNVSTGINRGWTPLTNVPYPDEQEEG